LYRLKCYIYPHGTESSDFNKPWIPILEGKPLAFSWCTYYGYTNCCNDALSEKPSRWETMQPDGVKQSMCRGDRKSTEVREAVSLCHELHVNPAHGRQAEQWEAQVLE